MKKLILLGAFALSLSAFGQSKLRYNFDEIRRDTINMISYVIDTKEPVSGIVYTNWPNGKLKSEIEWRNGKISGVIKSWYESGSIEAIGMFKDNKMEGALLRFYESGQTLEEAWAENDSIKIIKQYYPSGILARKLHSENGKLISGECYDESGELRECGENKEK